MASVLVVELDVVEQGALLDLVAQQGFEVIGAETPDDATAVLESFVIDAVVTVIDPAHAAGSELVRAVREHEARGSRRTPIIAVCQSAPRAHAGTLVTAAVDAWLQRPVRAETMRRTLWFTIALSRLGRSGRPRSRMPAERQPIDP